MNNDNTNDNNSLLLLNIEYISTHYNDELIDIVTLESAKRLKKLGFNLPTYYWQDKNLSFVNKGLKRVKFKERRMNHNKYETWIYSAPTRNEVNKWLNKHQ